MIARYCRDKWWYEVFACKWTKEITMILNDNFVFNADTIESLWFKPQEEDLIEITINHENREAIIELMSDHELVSETGIQWRWTMKFRKKQEEIRITKCNPFSQCTQDYPRFRDEDRNHIKSAETKLS